MDGRNASTQLDAAPLGSQVAIVTGASSGLGHATAIALALVPAGRVWGVDARIVRMFPRLRRWPFEDRDRRQWGRRR